MKPATQYTRSGHMNIAYQVFGSGSIDLVYIPGWVSNIDWMWSCPDLVDFLEELGKTARVILFDKRGTGLSDRLVESSTLEERMDDIRAVMDAAGSERAVLFGHYEGGCIAALFAATYPNRVVSLITFGIYAKRRHCPEYPWAPTDEEHQKVFDMIENNWESGGLDLRTLAPSKADDSAFMDWLASYFRSGASPNAALMLKKMNTLIDITTVLPFIKVPTLLMQRTHDVDVKIEEGRFVAERIKDVKLVELEGNDHLFWIGNTKEVLSEMIGFIRSEKPVVESDKRLFTVVVARIISKEMPEYLLHELIEQCVQKYSGEVVQYDGNTFTATFEAPSKAAHCSVGLLSKSQSWCVQLGIGVCVSEWTATRVNSAGNESGDIASSVLSQTKPNQILITQTAKHLLSGAGLNFVAFASEYYPFSGDMHELYLLDTRPEVGSSKPRREQRRYPKQDSFLEDLLRKIEEYLDNESFDVHVLCKEIGISQRQLQRKLKAITDKSPNQLITSVRLHHAKHILASSQYTIAEIAFRTGFSTPSYFSKCFKREFGVSPSAILNGLCEVVV